MTTRRLPVSALLALSIVLASTTPSAIAAVASAPSDRVNMADLVRQYTADVESVRDGLVLPTSDESLERLRRLQREWKRRLRGVDLARLDRAGKLDYILLENHIAETLNEIHGHRQRLDEIAPLIGFRKVILDLERDRRHARRLDLPATAERLADMADRIEALRQRVEKADADASEDDKDEKEERKETQSDASSPLPVTPAVALRASKAVGQLRDLLSEWRKQYSGYEPRFEWWLQKPVDRADGELERYAKHLKQQIAGQHGKPDDPMVGAPLGAEATARAIRFEMLPYTADELIAIGRAQLAWGESEMKKAAAEMGHGDDWRAAMAEVKRDHVPPGRQAELVARIGREATRFVTQRELITVPPLAQSTWRLTIMSADKLKTVPYAAYGNQRMFVAYPRQSQSVEDKLMMLRGNNRHFTRLVVPHELIPGHHLQHFYLDRHHRHRRVFASPFYFEGWALYWERRLWELGWAETPEDRIGMLFWWMTRAARIVVTLEYHLGRMDPEEMVTLLEQRVGHERFGARAEVRRFVQASPLYQVGYMIGGLQLEALQHEQVERGRMTEREFHDTILHLGPMPIAMLRAWIQGSPLKPGRTPQWRFSEAKRCNSEKGRRGETGK